MEYFVTLYGRIYPRSIQFCNDYKKYKKMKDMYDEYKKEAVILENDSLLGVAYPAFCVSAASIICWTRDAMLDGSGCSPSTNRALS